MARKPRLHYPGALYHVMLRGNDGQEIFHSDADRSRFTLLLKEGIERYGHRIHAFCFMTNHVHLAVQVDVVPLSRIIQNLAFRYTRYINAKLKKSGHLFQGRYKAILIDADSYLLELVRYIHLNPVRAGMVKDPADFRWSGQRTYLGKEKIEWLTTDWVFSFFSSHTSKACKQYAAFVKDGLGETAGSGFRDGTCEGRLLGDDSFIESALKKAEEVHRPKLSVASIVDCVCSAYGVGRQDLSRIGKYRRSAEARAVAALLVRETEGLSLTALGKMLKQEISSLSVAARRLEERAGKDKALMEKVMGIREETLEMSKCQA